MRKHLAKLRKLQQYRRGVAKEKGRTWRELAITKGQEISETKIALLRHQEAISKNEQVKLSRLRALKKLAQKRGDNRRAQLLDESIEAKIELLYDLDQAIKEQKAMITKDLMS